MPRFAVSRLLVIVISCLLAVTLISACGNKGPLKKPQPSATQAR